MSNFEGRYRRIVLGGKDPHEPSDVYIKGMFREADKRIAEKDAEIKRLRADLEGIDGFEGSTQRVRAAWADLVETVSAGLKTQMVAPALTIPQLVEQAHSNAVEKKWYEGGPINFGERLMLIVSEVSEALEDFRNGEDFTKVWYEGTHEGQKVWSYIKDEKCQKPCGIPSELADVVIRVADLCGHYGIDLEAAIKEKMAYNRTRPARHGGKKA